MKTITTSITIDASKEKVWEVLTNFEAYKNWNPFITKISGTLEPASRLKVTILPPEGQPMFIKPQVLSVDPGTGFQWVGNLFHPFIFTGTHSFRLEQTGTAVTFHHNEQFPVFLCLLFLAFSKAQNSDFRK
ncbi:MAG: SRPBCC family protein [Methyloligellaceae bacterium]